MRDHSQHIEISREEAVSRLLAVCKFAPAIETIPVAESFGRVLAHDAIAQLDMPNCLTCRMDSVAVHWSDFENGMPDTSTWKRGVDWEFANTGIGMPEGFDTAIVIEHVTLSEDESAISFDTTPSERFAGTSPAGSRMKKGDVLVEAGSVLTPLLVSHIASGNNASVAVIAKPKVAFIPTGNELVPVGSKLERAKNIETNSLLLRGKIEAWGGQALIFDIVPDDQELIKQALLAACEQADIVVINAGSSKGSDDWNVEMLDEIGEVLYHQTNHGPGHHSSGALIDGVPIVGISGPPGGAAFTTDFYLYPLIRRYLGLSSEMQKVQVRLAAEFSKSGSAKKAPKKPDAKGEVRPSIVKEDDEFFGIKQLIVSQAADGCLEASPTKSGRPGPVEAETANAYWAQSSLLPVPQPGDSIELELRPQ